MGERKEQFQSKENNALRLTWYMGKLENHVWAKTQVHFYPCNKQSSSIFQNLFPLNVIQDIFVLDSFLQVSKYKNSFVI